MKRIPFLRRPIPRNFKRPRSKAEEPDCLFRRNLPSLIITTQSLEKERDGMRGAIPSDGIGPAFIVI
jgi:hypothetical protein